MSEGISRVPVDAVPDLLKSTSERSPLRVVRAEEIPTLVTEMISDARRISINFSDTEIGREMFAAEFLANQIRALQSAAGGDVNPDTNTGLPVTGLTSDEFRRMANELFAAAKKEGIAFDLL